jgi:hypothetical protein
MPHNTAMKKESPIESFIALRAAVGFLGQSEKWWNCKFLESVGPRMLQTIFPRTSHQAAHRSAIQAGSLHHDKALGQRGISHLFRLPADVEEALSSHTESFTDKHWSALFLENKEQALDSLRKRCSAEIKVSPGPVQIGTIGQVLTHKSTEELAMHYHSAFIQQVQCLPYFGGKTSGRR